MSRAMFAVRKPDDAPGNGRTFTDYTAARDHARKLGRAVLLYRRADGLTVYLPMPASDAHDPTPYRPDDAAQVKP